MASSTNVFIKPEMEMGNYGKDTQSLLQDPWLTLLHQLRNSKQNTGTYEDYGNGKTNLQEALSNIRRDDPSAINELFTSPLSGGKAAAEQVQNNPLFASMFGKGGIQDQRIAEESNLASRGYSLKPEDYEAYGQASDNIARLFGNQENNISQMLASRGLAAGPSGAAGVAYSGLMGNKNEQLAQAQRQIANDRMKMNADRLASVRSSVNQGNQLAQSAWDSQKQSNMAGSDDYQKRLMAAYGVTQDFNNQNAEQFKQDQATKFSPGALIGGVLGTAVSGGLGNLAGGLGTGIASNITGVKPVK